MNTGNRMSLLIQGMNYFARFSLGAVFLVSGIIKMFSPSAAIAFVASSDIIPLSASILVYLVSMGEVLLGGLLISGVKQLIASVAASLILILFTFYGVVILEPGQPCGCFGGLWESSVDETFFLRDFGLIALSLFAVWRTPRTETEQMK